MDGVVSTVYVMPAQVFRSDAGLLFGPPGVLNYLGVPCGEAGCYGIALCDNDNVARAKVYESKQSYECFSPAGPWVYVGEVPTIRGFMLLLEKEFQYGRDSSMSLWDFFSLGCHRIMYAMQASPTSFYLRVRAPRMPDGFYAVYRIFGIETILSWWQASGYSFVGIMSYEEADDALSDV